MKDDRMFYICFPIAVAAGIILAFAIPIGCGWYSAGIKSEVSSSTIRDEDHRASLCGGNRLRRDRDMSKHAGNEPMRYVGEVEKSQRFSVVQGNNPNSGFWIIDSENSGIISPFVTETSALEECMKLNMGRPSLAQWVDKPVTTSQSDTSK